MICNFIRTRLNLVKIESMTAKFTSGIIGLSLSFFTQVVLGLSTLQDEASPCLGEVSFIEKPVIKQIAPLKTTPIWENGFEDVSEWIASGPVGADGENYGWSIGTTTNSSYSQLAADMGTSGSFARFGNGSLSEYFSGGPFTSTYQGTIDLSDVINPFLEFDQYGARFRTIQAVQISLDGINWVTVSDNNQLLITSSFGVNIYPRPMLQRVQLAPFLDGDISSVHIRLFWDGMTTGTSTNYYDYGWYVDNMKIKPGYEHDLRLDYSTAHFNGQYGYMYRVIPLQVGNAMIGFKAKVTNVGNNIEQVYLNVSSGSFNMNSPSVELHPNESTILEINENQGYPTYNSGTAFAIQVKSNNILENIDDDFDSFSFSKSNMHSNVMALDRFQVSSQPLAMDGGFSGWSNGTEIQGIGGLFEKLNSSNSIGHVGIGIAQVSTSNQQQYIGNTVYGEIWDYDDYDETFSYVGKTIEHQIQADDFGKVLTLKMDAPGDCASSTQKRILVLACFHSDQKVPVAYSGNALYGTVMGRNDNQFVYLAANHAGSVFSRAPVVSPHFYCHVGLDENENIGQSSTIFPNPASSYAEIEFTLPVEDAVNISIIDLMGKKVLERELGKLAAAKHKFPLQIERLDAGSYTLLISTKNKYEMLKIIVLND